MKAMKGESSTGPQRGQHLFTSDSRVPLEAVISTAERDVHELLQNAILEARYRARSALAEQCWIGTVRSSWMPSAAKISTASAVGIGKRNGSLAMRRRKRLASRDGHAAPSYRL